MYKKNQLSSRKARNYNNEDKVSESESEDEELKMSNKNIKYKPERVFNTIKRDKKYGRTVDYDRFTEYESPLYKDQEEREYKIVDYFDEMLKDDHNHNCNNINNTNIPTEITFVVRIPKKNTRNRDENPDAAEFPEENASVSITLDQKNRLNKVIISQKGHVKRTLHLNIDVVIYKPGAATATVIAIVK